MGESYSGIRALADFICDVTKYQHHYVPNLGRQLLHKYIKCKHQHSGRGLLLTISTSVGKYLYAGEIRVKTHFMSRKTHSIDQAKMCNQSENTSQAQLDQNKPMHPSKPA